MQRFRAAHGPSATVATYQFCRHFAHAPSCRPRFAHVLAYSHCVCFLCPCVVLGRRVAACAQSHESALICMGYALRSYAPSGMCMRKQPATPTCATAMRSICYIQFVLPWPGCRHGLSLLNGRQPCTEGSHLTASSKGFLLRSRSWGNPGSAGATWTHSPTRLTTPQAGCLPGYALASRNSYVL
jgi:hypothetical protein